VRINLHNRLQTLHAIYSKACLEPMRAALEGGRRQIAVFFSQMRVAYVELEETRRYNQASRSFVNVNTPAQMAEAAAWSRHDLKRSERY
jgi:molybdopterin-guanine dinucleotide biosynthesis protein A